MSGAEAAHLVHVAHANNHAMSIKFALAKRDEDEGGWCPKLRVTASELLHRKLDLGF